jgi:hypothetical protein
MRLLNFCVLVLLVLAAAYVYEIKFESTLRAERVAKMRGDVRASATPSRRCAPNGRRWKIPRASRPGAAHLQLRPAEPTQYDRSIACRSGRRRRAAAAADAIAARSRLEPGDRQRPA